MICFHKTLIFLMVMFLSLQAEATSFCTKSQNRDLDLKCDVEESSVYFGVNRGHVTPSVQVLNYSPGNSSSGSLGIVLGRRLTDTYAFEAAYILAGSLYDSASTNTTDVNIYSFTGLARMPLDSNHYFSLYGRFGWAISYVTIQDVGNNWHGDLTYGGGLEIVLGTKRYWYLRAGLDEYNTGALSVLVPGQPVPRDKLDTFSVTLLFNF